MHCGLTPTPRCNHIDHIILFVHDVDGASGELRNCAVPSIVEKCSIEEAVQPRRRVSLELSSVVP
jgi:hypothetical protein